MKVKVKMKNKIKYIVFILLAVSIVDYLFYFQITNYYDKQSEIHLNELIRLEEIKVNSSINTYNLVSEAVFSQIVSKPEVLELFSKASSKNTNEQHVVRNKLFKMLSDTYEKLKSMNIKQLHFHLPDNTSFLRFHRPNKYGDNLRDDRPSVVYANSLLTIQKGFEEGKIYNGFRYVYPLFFNDKHIGSVETSFSFEAIKKQLNLLGVPYLTFLINGKIADNIVFKEEMINYQTSSLSNDYYEEKNNIYKNQDTLKFLREINEKVRLIIKDQIASKKSFAVNAEQNDANYLVSFININNLYHNHSAYVVTYNKDYQIEQINKSKTLSLVIGLIGLPIIIMLISNFYINHLKIKDQNMMLKQTEISLLELNKKLEDLNYSKDRFFSIISHDLRSPFSSLIGFSQLLHQKFDDFEPDEVKESIGHIYSVSKKTYSLLENLLQWSKLQTSDMKANLSTINLYDFIIDGLDLLKASAEQKSINIMVDIQKDSIIQADREMLNVIIRNLIGNAIKFTPKGGMIELKSQKDGDFIKLKILDSGVGMDSKTLDNLFRIDIKTSNAGTEGEKGSGLGLLLCKELSIKMGGDIIVESELGKGSTFIVLLKIDS